MIMEAHSTVQHKQVLVGWSSDRNVQVFILSNDQKWYLQKKVHFHGRSHRFSVKCFFGDERTTQGASFQVVAVITDKRPHSPVLELPEGERSEPITVILK